MLNLLKKLCSEGKYVSVFFGSSNDSKFIYGKILCVNEKFAAIYMLDLKGNYGGIVAHRTEDILRIEIGGLYGEKMNRLSTSSPAHPEPWPLDEDHIIESLLQKAQDARKIVSIELQDSGYDDEVGFVENLTCNLCVVRKINEYGVEDGEAIMKIQNITQIACESESEEIVEMLFDNRHDKRD